MASWQLLLMIVSSKFRGSMGFLSGPPPHSRLASLWEANQPTQCLQLLAQPKRRGLEVVIGRPKGFLHTPRLLPQSPSLPKPLHLPLKAPGSTSNLWKRGQNTVWRNIGSFNSTSLGLLRRPNDPTLGEAREGSPQRLWPQR